MKTILLSFAICLLFLNSSITSAQNVSTFAGSSVSGFNDGQGVLAQFKNPYGSCIDASGNIYIADTYNYRIRKITPTGSVTTVAGSGINSSVDGTGAGASFMNPISVCIDQNGNLYVGEATQPRIRKISPLGVVTTLAGTGFTGSNDGPGNVATFSSIDGLCVDVNGDIYIADSGSLKIRKLTASGNVTTIAGNAGPQAYVDGVGTSASFYYPSAICISVSGDLYVADGHKIRKVTTTGTVTTIAGTGAIGSANGQGTLASFYYPQGICIDNSNNLFISDSENHLIRKIDATGSVTTVAGTGSAGSLDGFGTSASFSRPFDISVDLSGNLYVAEYNNSKIRKIDFNSAGIQTITNSIEILVFPNPAKDYIQIQTNVKPKSIKVSDLLGRAVLSSEPVSIPIDISSLSKGVYFIEFQSEEAILKQKFIKE